MTLLARIVETSLRVGETRSRLAKVREIAQTLRALEPDELETAVLYMSGETPQGKSGVGYATLRDASGGAGAAKASLAILDVDRQLQQLGSIRGAGSAARRELVLRDLFSKATASEQEFLLRLLVGELRQGALAGVMVDAIAAAADVSVDQIRRASMYAANLGRVAHVAITEGTASLAQFQLKTLSPVAPMLAQVATDVTEALEILGGKAVFDWKMDGARIQVHRLADAVRVYTRALNDVTAAVPEVVEAVRALPDTELVLDGEVIALNPAGRPLPFQTTMRRFGRKLDVETLRAELPLQAFFFDCLRRGAHSLVDQPTHERLSVLATAVPAAMQMPRLITASTPEAQAFQEAALARGHEGIMAKSLDATYQAGNRGSDWLKIKHVHSLDLVVLAAEWGHGRRTGQLSNLHLGALDPVTDEYVMLGKTFKGLTDAMLEWQTKEFLARQIRSDAGTVYIRPEIVVEIAFSDLQASPRYPGGLALRLARVKAYRPDKRVQDADTMATVRQIYASQSGQEAHAAHSKPL